MRPDVETYFSMVSAAKDAIERGERLSYEEALKAHNDGFPTPQPGANQVWFTIGKGGVTPIVSGTLGFHDGRWQVAIMLEFGDFFVYDGRFPEYVPSRFLYAPTPEAIEQFWNHLLEVSHGVVDLIY